MLMLTAEMSHAPCCALKAAGDEGWDSFRLLNQAHRLLPCYRCKPEGSKKQCTGIPAEPVTGPIPAGPKADGISLLPARYPWESKLRSIYSHLSHTRRNCSLQCC